jgi:2-dehydropantoate 2-reductase
MKIAVMGADAVGCYYGFKLARAGHDVVLIGRPQHVEAIERHGLRLETQTFDEHVRVSASTEGSAVQGARLVLFLREVHRHRKRCGCHQAASCAGCVGVVVAKRRRECGPTAHAAATGSGRSRRVCRDRNGGPGHVRHHGRDELVIEPSKASDDLARALIAVGVP